MAPLLRTRQAIVGLGLKTTRIAIGMFMDYFGHPNIPSTLRPSQWAIDVATRRATIPGTGDDLVTLTYSKDVAKFVARLVDDDDWPEHSIISGSDVSMNDIVALAEKATGTSSSTLLGKNMPSNCSTKMKSLKSLTIALKTSRQARRRWSLPTRSHTMDSIR